MVLLLAMVGCAWSGTPPTCLDARTRGFDVSQRFRSDAAGGLVEHAQIDRTGEIVATTTATWGDGELRLDHGGAFAFQEQATLGSHGELLAWTMEGRTTSLVWTGTFADPVGTGRFALESYYHPSLDGTMVLPLDTETRGPWSRMRALRFTGSVVLTEPDGSTVIAEYIDGLQQAIATGGTRTTTTWTGRLPASQVQTDASGATLAKRDYTHEDGRVRTIRGDVDLDFEYRGGVLSRVSKRGTPGTTRIDISRCD